MFRNALAWYAALAATAAALAAACPSGKGKALAVDDAVVRFERAADEWYDAVRMGDRGRSLAQAHLVRLFAAEVRSANLAPSAAMNAVESAIARGERALSADAGSDAAAGAALAAAASVRLAADAMAGHRVPLWKQYIRPVRDDLDRLTAAVRAADRNRGSQAVALLAARLDLLEPAALVAGRNPEETSRIRVLLADVGRRLDDRARPVAELAADVSELRKSVLALFGGDDDRDVFAYRPSLDDGGSLVRKLAPMFAAILAALGYAGYRIYRYEQDIVPVRGKGADRSE